MGGAFGCSESGFRLPHPTWQPRSSWSARRCFGMAQYLSSWMPEFRSSGPSDGLIETNEMIGNTSASYPMDVRQKEHLWL